MTGVIRERAPAGPVMMRSQSSVDAERREWLVAKLLEYGDWCDRMADEMQRQREVHARTLVEIELATAFQLARAQAIGDA